MTEMAKALSKEMEKNEKLQKQLTEAREIIKKLAIFIRDNCYTRTLGENLDRQGLLTKAEQFLGDEK